MIFDVANFCFATTLNLTSSPGKENWVLYKFRSRSRTADSEITFTDFGNEDISGAVAGNARGSGGEEKKNFHLLHFPSYKSLRICKNWIRVNAR